MNHDFNTPIETAEDFSQRLDLLSSAGHQLALEIGKMRQHVHQFGDKSRTDIHRNLSIALADAESVHLRTSLASLFLNRVIKENKNEA